MNKYSKTVVLIIAFSLVMACTNKKSLTYKEVEIINTQISKISIHIPKVEGNTKVAQKINTSLESFTTSALQLETNKNTNISLDSSINNFNRSYKTFKNQVEKITLEPLPVWEAIIEGEKIYEDENLVCFSMTSTINTGASKGTTLIKFLNFDKTSGQLLTFNDLISNASGFNSEIESYLIRELMAYSSYNIDQFKLKEVLKNPDEISFNDNGIIALFKTNFNDYIEIAVPFEKIGSYLTY